MNTNGSDVIQLTFSNVIIHHPSSRLKELKFISSKTTMTEQKFGKCVPLFTNLTQRKALSVVMNVLIEINSEKVC